MNFGLQVASKTNRTSQSMMEELFKLLTELIAFVIDEFVLVKLLVHKQTSAIFNLLACSYEEDINTLLEIINTEHELIVGRQHRCAWTRPAWEDVHD